MSVVAFVSPTFALATVTTLLLVTFVPVVSVVLHTRASAPVGLSSSVLGVEMSGQISAHVHFCVWWYKAV